MLHPDNYEEVIANRLAEMPRGRHIFSVIPRSPNQIKSADPATFDDNGKIIPLSERFDSGNPDIRFSFVGAKGLVNQAQNPAQKQFIKDGINAAKLALSKPNLTMEDKRKVKKNWLSAFHTGFSRKEEGTFSVPSKRSDSIYLRLMPDFNNPSIQCFKRCHIFFTSSSVRPVD